MRKTPEYIKNIKLSLPKYREFERYSSTKTFLYCKIASIVMFIYCSIYIILNTILRFREISYCLKAFLPAAILSLVFLILSVVIKLCKIKNVQKKQTLIYNCNVLLVVGFIAWSIYTSYIFPQEFAEGQVAAGPTYMLWLITIMISTCLIYIVPHIYAIIVFASEYFIISFIPNHTVKKITFAEKYNLVVVGIICVLWMCVRFFQGLHSYTKTLTIEELMDEQEKIYLSLTHDMRTPLNVILGKCTVIKNQSTNKELLDITSEIEISSNIILSRVNDILDLSKMKSKSQKICLYSIPYKPLETANEIYKMFYSEAKSHNLDLHLEISPNYPYILKGDEARLKQILTNLIGNAIKYTKKGSVDIIFYYEITNRNTCIMTVEIQDTGIGIKKEDFDKLTKEFNRVNNENTKNIEGTGLGLNVVSRLLNLMNSKLRIESTYGVGSTFSFRIEQKIIQLNNTDFIADEDKQSSSTYYKQDNVIASIDDDEQETPTLDSKNKLSNNQKNPPNPQGLTLSSENNTTTKDSSTNNLSTNNTSKNDSTNYIQLPNIKALIVDDMAVNCSVCASLLEFFAIKSDSVYSGDECIKKIEANQYDIIFIDHLMPEKDGIETIKEIKEKYPNIFESTPIISLTGSVYDDSEKMFKEAGFSDFLSKPINMDSLNRIITHYFEKK